MSPPLAHPQLQSKSHSLLWGFKSRTLEFGESQNLIAILPIFALSLSDVLHYLLKSLSKMELQVQTVKIGQFPYIR